MRTLAWLPYLVGTLVIAVACSSSDDANDPGTTSSGASGSSTSGSIGGGSSSSGASSSSGGSSVSLDGYANAVCAKVQRCQPKGFLVDWATKDECVADVIASNQAGLTALPGSQVSQAQVDACAAKVAATSCAFRLDDLEECALTGTFDDGTPCYDGRQCKSGRCKRGFSDDCGTCAPHESEGGECIEVADCAFGLSCEGTAAPGACTKALERDAACTKDGPPCGPGLRCVSGHCADPVADGGACAPDGDECSRGLTCQSSVCKEPVTNVAALGEKCPGDTVCRKSSCRGAPGSETCVAYAREGADCGFDRDGPPECDADSACIDGTCEGNTFPDCH
jgi:hypothetical protein